MKISKVIFHIKPIPSHPWWECKKVQNLCLGQNTPLIRDVHTGLHQLDFQAMRSVFLSCLIFIISYILIIYRKFKIIFYLMALKRAPICIRNVCLSYFCVIFIHTIDNLYKENLKKTDPMPKQEVNKYYFLSSFYNLLKQISNLFSDCVSVILLYRLQRWSHAHRESNLRNFTQLLAKLGHMDK